MRILLSTYGSRGDLEPLAGLALALKAIGADAVVSTPTDDEFTELLGRAGVELAPACMPIRQWMAEAAQAPTTIPALAARLVPLQYAAIDVAAADCDAIVSTGLFPSTAAAQCVAERRGLHYTMASFCPLFLPSHLHPPVARPGRPHPEGLTDPRALWALNSEDMYVLFGAAVNAQRNAVGLQPINNVQERVFTHTPLLASDPTLWPWEPTELCAPVQTGVWILPDHRPLRDGLEAFLNAGPPPVYVGFGSIAIPTARQAAVAAVEAARRLGRRLVLARGWADNALPEQADDVFLVGEINQQALFPRMAAVVHHGGAGASGCGRSAPDRGPALLGPAPRQAGRRGRARWPITDGRFPGGRPRSGFEPRDRRPRDCPGRLNAL